MITRVMCTPLAHQTTKTEEQLLIVEESHQHQ